jgi:hypothetical protein
MRRDRHELRQLGRDRPAPVAADPDLGAEQSLRGGRSQQDNCAGSDHRELGPQPRQTRIHLPAVGLLVNATLAASLVAEVLDDVRDVRIARRDPRPLEPLVEHAPGRPDERVALDVLAFAGLLAHQHQRRPAGPLAHHRLGGGRVQVASAARLDRAPQIAE